jgi:hypothetical protein
MSDSLRIHLPTNREFDLPEVDLIENPNDYPVAAPALPGRSEDELLLAAENGDWDLYDTHGIGQDPLPMTALYNRFADHYRGDAFDRPGGFIKAVLSMQRTIPTAKEYATVLAKDGLIRPDEAVSLSNQFSYDMLQTDEGATQARAHFKVSYLANAVSPELRTAKLASDYASDKIKSASDSRARSRAAETMYRARGIDEQELSKLMDGKTTASGRARGEHLRALGVSNELIDTLDSAPRPTGLIPCYRSADTIVQYGLGGAGLDRQVAYRRFLGIDNLVDMATAHAAVEDVYNADSVAFSRYAIAAHLAGSLLFQTNTDPNIPFISRFHNGEVAADLGITDVLPQLGSFALCMMREPALNGEQNHIYPRSDVLGHNVVDTVTIDYRVLLDKQMAEERLNR